MPMSVRLSRVLIGATLLASPSVARAQAAGGDERCSGTLCDFYYGNAPPAPAAPANGQTPLTVPSPGLLGKLFSGGGDVQPAAPGATPGAPHPLVQVQGGGLLGRVTGAPPPDRCSGTLCDFYYGGSAPEPVETPAHQTGAAADPVPEPTADDIAPPVTRRRDAEVEEKPGCVSPANDPWRCYRK